MRMLQIWSLLFRRLQSSKTTKFSRAFIVFLAFFITQQGAGAVATSVDAVQPGLFGQLLQGIWLPALASVSGRHEEKLVAVATTKVCLQGPFLQKLYKSIENSLGAKALNKSWPLDDYRLVHPTCWRFDAE